MYKVNLLPQELLAGAGGAQRNISLRKILLVTAGFLIALYIILALCLFIGRWQVDTRRKSLSALEPRIQQVDSLRNKAVILKARAAAWQNILSKRRTYRSLLEDFNSRLPVDMWLTRVEISRPEQQTSLGATPVAPQPQAVPQAIPQPTRVVIEGGTSSLASVGVYVNNLGKLPYFKNVALKDVKEVTTTAPERVTVFTIEASLGEGGRR